MVLRSHQYPLYSCRDAFEELRFWCVFVRKWLIRPIFVSWKSMAYLSRWLLWKGILVAGVTRDGSIKNITENLKRVKDIPLTSSRRTRYHSRGECYFTRFLWSNKLARQEMEIEFANPLTMRQQELCVVDTAVVAKRNLRNVSSSCTFNSW